MNTATLQRSVTNARHWPAHVRLWLWRCVAAAVLVGAGGVAAWAVTAAVTSDTSDHARSSGAAVGAQDDLSHGVSASLYEIGAVVTDGIELSSEEHTTWGGIGQSKRWPRTPGTLLLHSECEANPLHPSCR